MKNIKIEITKRKLLFSAMLCAFAGLTLLNLGLARSQGETDTTLDLISVMAQAYDEGEGGEEELGGPGTCGYQVWSETYNQFFSECGVNKLTAYYMMGLCELEIYSDCHWCCNSCSSSTYCGGS